MIPATAALPRVHDPSVARRAGMARTFFTATLFLSGLCAWIFKPRYYYGGEPLIPFSPLQVLLPLLGAVAVGYIVLTSGAHLPRVMRPGRATFVLNLGIILIIGGAALHVGGGQYGMDAVLYILRWLLPWSAVLLLFLAAKSGANVRPLIYGYFGGAILTIVCVELARAGFNLPICKMRDARYAGFLNHANQYGILVSGTAPFILYLLLSGKRLAQVSGVAMIGLYWLALFQSMSKTNFILYVLALCLAVLALSLRTAATFARSLIIIILVAAGLAGIGTTALNLLYEFAPRDAELFENAIFDPQGVKSLDDRHDAWEEAIAYIKDRPLLGMGPGWGEENLLHQHAHNLMLQLWLEAGIAGLIGMCLIILAILLRAWHVARDIIGTRTRLTETQTIQALAVIALIISLMGNAMSSSLNTATMTVFVLFLAMSFVNPPENGPVSDEQTPPYGRS